ncbi:MAG TPA: tetratricopeptide repeat protein [Rickettsia endosymbiont of Bembidion lapponicum]|nr:tetratricopeptide repeat protein [Rickettsia endosymbiont of Bembidion lapponicum]
MKKYILLTIILLMSKNIFAREQISNLVTPVSYFINHTSQIKKIKSNLIKYKQSGILGVSGMGKTQIARMYAYDNKADYDLIWFIDCNLDIDGQLMKLAKVINAQANSAIISDNISMVRKELMTYLASKDKWLLVFDNLKVGENKKVADFINWEHNGNIIFCSQDSELLPNIVKITAFEEKESKMLVENILESNNPESIEFLAQEFKGYPILMVQGSQILNQVQGLSLNEYKKQIQGANDKIELNIRLAINVLSPSARKLLNEIALINNQSFSKEFLNCITSDKDHLDDDIYNISKFALITNIEPNEDNPTFEMHDVIAEKILKINGYTNNKESIDQVVTNYISSVPSSVVKARIFRNAKTVLGNIDIITKNAEKYDIPINVILGLKINLITQYINSLDLYSAQKLVDWFNENDSKGNFKLSKMDNDQKCDYASYLSLIGGYYRHLGNHHKSIEYDIRAKKVYEDIQGYNSYRCNINYTLALAYIELGQLEEAKNNIQIMEDMFNGGLVDKADIITLYSARARLFAMQGKYDDALEQINNTINTAVENGINPQDVFLSNIYLIKADILNNLGKYEEAYSQAQQIYDMNKLVKKENHLIFGRVFTQMSKAKLGLGNAKEALEYAEKAKTIFISDTNRPNKEIITSPDTSLAKAFVAEGNALASLNKNDEAVEAYSTAENIYWNNYRENMKNVDEISIMYLNAAKASCHVPLRSFYKNFRDHQIKKFGEQHPKSIEILKLNCHNLNN